MGRVTCHPADSVRAETSVLRLPAPAGCDHPTRGVGSALSHLGGGQRLQLVRKHFDTERRNRTNLIQGGHECLQVDRTVPGQEAIVESGVHQVRLDLCGSIVELDGKELGPRDLSERLEITRRGGPRPMPGVNGDTGIGTVGPPHDLPRSREIGDPRPWQKLNVDKQAIVRRPVAESCEPRGCLVERPVAAEHVHGVERSSTQRLSHCEQFLLAEAKHVEAVDASQRLPNLGRAREPPPRRIYLGDGQTTVVELDTEVGVRQPVPARRGMVAAPDGDTAKTGRARRRQSIAPGRRWWQRSRAQHQVASSKLHDLTAHAGAEVGMPMPVAGDGSTCIVSRT